MGGNNTDQIEEPIVLNSKATQLLFWKLHLIDRIQEVFLLSFWNRKEKAPTKKAIGKAVEFLKDINVLDPIPVAFPLKSGGIGMEDEEGKISAIITPEAGIIRIRKEIDAYIKKELE